MAWALVEAVVDAAVEYITTNHSAKFDVVDARYGDSVTLSDFAGLYHSAPNLDDIQELPVLFAKGRRGQSSATGTGGIGQGFIGEYRVMFVVFYELAVDESGAGTLVSETLARQGERYMVAILEMLAEGSGNGAGKMGYQWGTGAPWQIDYGETVPVRDNTGRAGFVALEIGVVAREAGL